MKFKSGDRVQTNPNIKTQPSNWNVDGQMWEPHLERCVMTIRDVADGWGAENPRYRCVIDKTGESWVYKESELIPYQAFFEEVEEL